MPIRIPIRFISGEPPFVTVKAFWIDGGSSADMDLIVDTGASDIAVSQDSAAMLGAKLSQLHRLRASLSGIGGRVGTFELCNLALMFTSETRVPWQTILDSVTVFQNPSTKSGERREFMPSLMGRAFMEDHNMILHWDFGGRVAYLDVPESTPGP